MSDTLQTTDETETPRGSGWGKKLLWLVLVLFVLLFVLIILARFIVTTSVGHRFIEGQLNDRNLGPVERVQIDGMSGDLLGAFTIDSVQVFDKNGLWMSAEDLQINWSPLALLSSNLKLNDVAISRADILRKPELNASNPDGVLPDITAPQLTVDTFALSEAFAGQSAAFAVEAGATLTQTQKALKLNLERTDTAGDTLKLDVSQGRSGTITGNFLLTGVAEGPIATVLRAPTGQSVSGEGDISGTTDAGQGELSISFGSTKVMSAAGNWTPETLGVNADANITAWPEFTNYQNALGETLNIEAELTRTTTPRQFNTIITSKHVNATAKGVLPDEGFKPDAADISVKIDNPESLGALPEGFALGSVSADGRAALTPAMSFNGRIAASGVRSPYGRLAAVTGPINVRMAESEPVAFDVNLDGQGLAVEQDLPIALAKNIKLSAAGRYNLDTKLLSLTKSTVVSGSNQVSAKGRADIASQNFDLSGAANVALLERGSVPSGQLIADYTLQKTASSAPALSTTGTFAPTSAMRAPLGDLLGDKVTFKTSMTPIDGGLRIADAALSGENIKAVLEGQITDTLDIALEAQTAEGFVLSGVEVGDRTDVTARITGTRSDPNIKVQAEASALTIGGRNATEMTLKAEVTDVLSAPKGPVQLTAVTEYGDFEATANFASVGDDITAADIRLTLGKVTALGDMTYRANGLLDGALKLDLPQEDDSFARAELTLAPSGGDTQNLNFVAEAENIAFEDFEFDNFAVDAAGTLDALSGDIALKGRRNVGVLSRPITLAAPFSVSRDEQSAIALQTDPEGVYGNIKFGARETISLTYKAPELSFTAPLILSDKPVDISYSRLGTGEESLNS